MGALPHFREITPKFWKLHGQQKKAELTTRLFNFVIHHKKLGMDFLHHQHLLAHWLLHWEWLWCLCPIYQFQSKPTSFCHFYLSQNKNVMPLLLLVHKFFDYIFSKSNASDFIGTYFLIICHLCFYVFKRGNRINTCRNVLFFGNQ